MATSVHQSLLSPGLKVCAVKHALWRNDRMCFSRYRGVRCSDMLGGDTSAYKSGKAQEMRPAITADLADSPH